MIYQNYLVTKENKSLAIQYPEVAALWHPTKNGGLTPAMFSPHTNTHVWWLGNCGHEWDSPITVMTKGCGCPYCHGLRVLKGFNDLETLYPDIAAQWHPAKNGNNKPDMFTSGSGHGQLFCTIQPLLRHAFPQLLRFSSVLPAVLYPCSSNLTAR